MEGIGSEDTEALKDCRVQTKQ